MYTALVVACLISNITSCAVIEDTLGPYAKADECYARTFQMASELDEELLEQHTYSFKCVKIPHVDT